MTLLRKIISGIQALRHKEQRWRDMDEELLAFQQASAAEKIRSGLDPSARDRDSARSYLLMPCLA